MTQNFAAPIWMTFNQAKELKANVRKGSKGSLVVYADRITKTETTNDGQENQRDIYFMKDYTVFNIEQIEGLPPHFYATATPQLDPVQRNEAADQFFANTGADIRHGGNQAYYAAEPDYVQMPPFVSFRDAESYCSTLAHEMTHWTKHPSRLDREFGRKKFGDEGYAREELVAEIGSAFLSCDLGITPSLFHTSRMWAWRCGEDSAMIAASGWCGTDPRQRSDAMIAPWAKEELATVDLGDERLDARFESLLSALGNRPNLSIPAACGGRAEMKAAYRFFDNDKVTFDKVLRPHIARTQERMAEQKVVLLVQDTTEIDLTRPEQEVAGRRRIGWIASRLLVARDAGLHARGHAVGHGVGRGTQSHRGRVACVDGGEAAQAETNADRREGEPALARRDCGRRGRWPSNCRESTASAWPTARPTFMSCLPNRGASSPSHWLIRACQDRALDRQATRAPCCVTRCWPRPCCTRWSC